MAKEKKEKPYIYDDGHTIVDMNVDGMPWYNPNRTDRKKKDKDKPSFKERMAMTFGAYRAFLPFVVATVVAFGLVALLLFLWLS